MYERKNEATINGSPLIVIGRKLTPGEMAPEVSLEEWPLCPFQLLADTAGKIRVISVVPCIDTGLCEMQTIRMNEEAGAFGDRVATITVSADLPAGQARFTGRVGIENLQMLSDHLDMAFGAAYGTWLKELRNEQRSIFVIDANDIIRHAQYVGEVGHAIDYDAAIKVVRALLAEEKDGFQRPTSKGRLA
jgi:thiol peroxidase